MKRNTLITTVAFGFAALTSAFAGGEGWLTDMDAAKAQASKEKKDLLLDFTGSDWCGWCIKLNKEVFDLAPFKEGVKDKFVLVELDFPHNKQLEPKLKEQNEAISKQMKVRGFPTIMLCDATGKPYAKTGYQPGGPEKYVASLDELQAVRVKRDAAFAAAEKASDDLAKAKSLMAGLNTMDSEIVENNYADVAEKIGQLDKDDKSGFAKARKDAAEKKEAIAKAQGAINQFMGSKIQPLMQAKDFDKALAEVKTYIKENPDTPEEVQASLLLNIGLAGPVSKGDGDAAMAFVDELVKTYPKTELAKSADMIKTNIKARLESMKNQKPEEK